MSLSKVIVAAVVGLGSVSALTAGDMYVFAYTFQPEFCYGMESKYPGCNNPKDYWKTHFTIHGLWPQYSSGGYPSSCTNEAFDPSVPQQIGWETMTTYWPDVKYAETDSNYDEFWEHEWSKHGGLSQYDYFTQAINVLLSLGTPQDYQDNVGSTMNAAELRTDFGGADKATLTCQSSVYIDGVYTCWSRNSDGSVGSRVVCPSDVQKEDTCTKTDVTIQSF